MSLFNSFDVPLGQGSNTFYEEALSLVYGILNLPFEEQQQKLFDCKLTSIEKKTLSEAIYKRIFERIPTCYLTNRSIFGGYTFYVDSRVLIPRSLIAEILYQDKLDPWLQKLNIDPSSITSGLDMCTGSGSLAVMLSGYFPRAKIVGVDVSPDALDVANINISNYGLQGKINPLL